MLPTVFWFAHGDAMLQGVCVAGAVISIVLFLGYFERAALVCLYVLYLSLCTAGQEFLFVPMGLPAARNWISGDLSRQLETGRVSCFDGWYSGLTLLVWAP